MRNYVKTFHVKIGHNLQHKFFDYIIILQIIEICESFFKAP